MINDLVPTGFSSAAAITLLKTMNSSMASNNSFLATAKTSAFNTSSKNTVSGDTMFSIIAAAASAKATAPAVAQTPPSTPAGQTVPTQPQTANASTPADAAAGQALLAADPDLQKNYTTDQAIDIWYGEAQSSAGFADRSGGNPTNESTGAVVAASYYLTGNAATSFATAYDNRTLKFSDPNATVSGLNSVVTHTVTTDSEGFPTGETYGQTFDEKAYSNYLTANNDSIIQTDFSQKSWQGVLISW